jgi:hypothetical protein
VERPSTPDAERCESLLATLGDLIARGGPASLLLPPVVPGDSAFPEPWRPTRGGVSALLRRLAWHAGNPRAIHVLDERLGAPPTERVPATRVALVGVRTRELPFRIEFIGADDVAGTLAHEIGVAHAVIHRPDGADPYRATEPTELDVDPERDLERGSIATVYLGLGTLSANAAFQQFSRPGRFNGGYSPLEYDVLQAGFLPMSDLAYLLAVQAAVRGADVPPGLSPPQRDETAAWLTALRPRADELRERLGIPADASASEARETPVRFDDIEVEDETPPPRRNAFRWRTHRGGVGFIAGAALGIGFSIALASHGAAPLIVLGAATSGHVLGRRVRVPRCSGCASVVEPTATACTKCGAALRGDIERLSDRLEAEEHLDDHEHV